VAAAWAAAAALTAVYAPTAPAARNTLPDSPGGPQAAGETFARAVEHGDEHVIKFADTAADVYARTGDPRRPRRRHPRHPSDRPLTRRRGDGIVGW
jgi:hypothetical protein